MFRKPDGFVCRKRCEIKGPIQLFQGSEIRS